MSQSPPNTLITLPLEAFKRYDPSHDDYTVSGPVLAAAKANARKPLLGFGDKPLGGQTYQLNQAPTMHQFATGATRSSDEGKNDYEGFLSFDVIEEFGDYMTRHRIQADGGVRKSDNWQKGIPPASYIKSFIRHSIELWGLHRGKVSRRLRREYPNQGMNFLVRETACACLFNLQGFFHEFLKVPSFIAYQPQPGLPIPSVGGGQGLIGVSDDINRF